MCDRFQQSQPIHGIDTYIYPRSNERYPLIRIKMEGDNYQYVVIPGHLDGANILKYNRVILKRMETL
jgi:hypothetical protein